MEAGNGYQDHRRRSRPLALETHDSRRTRTPSLLTHRHRHLISSTPARPARHANAKSIQSQSPRHNDSNKLIAPRNYSHACMERAWEKALQDFPTTKLIEYTAGLVISQPHTLTTHQFPGAYKDTESGPERFHLVAESSRRFSIGPAIISQPISNTASKYESTELC